MDCKQYIAVELLVDAEGGTHPTAIVWKDARRIPIDRVLDVRRAASLKAGGCGMRYTCRVRSRMVDLFCEDGRWFLDTSRFDS